MNAETLVVGIFDNSQDLERADKQLAAAGFEATIHDGTIAIEESCKVSPVPVGSLLAPGGPTEDMDGAQTGSSARVHGLKALLAACQLSDDVSDAYAAALSRKGKLVLVRTEPECVRHVIEILETCSPARVNRHELKTRA